MIDDLMVGSLVEMEKSRRWERSVERVGAKDLPVGRLPKMMMMM